MRPFKKTKCVNCEGTYYPLADNEGMYNHALSGIKEEIGEASKTMVIEEIAVKSDDT